MQSEYMLSFVDAVHMLQFGHTIKSEKGVTFAALKDLGNCSLGVNFLSGQKWKTVAKQGMMRNQSPVQERLLCGLVQSAVEAKQ